MKLKLEIDVPEYDWIDTPTLYRTPLGEFGDILEVEQVQYLIEYLQRLDDIEDIINSNHQHIRFPWCREVVRDRLRFIPDNQIWYVGEKLAHFLMDFQEYRTGYSFKDYEFDYTVLSDGKKIQFKTFTMMFDSEDEAYRHILKIATSDINLKYEVLGE